MKIETEEPGQEGEIWHATRWKSGGFFYQQMEPKWSKGKGRGREGPGPVVRDAKTDTRENTSSSQV